MRTLLSTSGRQDIRVAFLTFCNVLHKWGIKDEIGHDALADLTDAQVSTCIEAYGNGLI